MRRAMQPLHESHIERGFIVRTKFNGRADLDGTLADLSIGRRLPRHRSIATHTATAMTAR